nr:PREDICTED: uncharacterized protein LOC105672354 [Linepithema humile]
MSTLILTKGQQRQSLSAKKGRPAKGLRNILAQPFENYWPIVSTDKYPTLITLMNELLPLIKRPTFKIPGSMLRHVQKEKRILLRKEELEKGVKPDEHILKFVILGINAVTRALEKNDVCCILLDANVEPPLLIKHIVVMAQNKKIPILLLPVLKTITLEKIGFATAAFALKNDVILQSSENVFHALYKSIAEVFKDFEPSKCSLQLFKPDETSEASTDCNPTSNIPKQEKPVVFTDVYKYRSSRTERAFIPSSVSKSSQVFQTPSNEFIALSSDVDFANNKNSMGLLSNKRYVNINKEEKELENIEKDNIKFLEESKSNNTDSLRYTERYVPEKRKNDDVTYLPLKIKRIQGNSNRKKATKFAKKKKK